ncbi:MAG: SDR family NAD(P)-dependent oxidoreductase [Rhodospirillaceae bacterium]|jgi:UDP-glucuronate 4-epimerase|nr:SDR family NAD(P)-dependent oxidoreductase [Rhodospirillaceae bacterium]MBT3886575.1 SDR family NAD(P)-dependent oxidoreductase [Rhodospirillaceae bacterium]MBT4118885.1 SDR family NAD(P)-dependent oxidoreductase [Rhodospirillaceae bacterium]MBT4672703.1 SDR family NAD(P)-dependent oxidoreductase [Rhodospirillaceae bacterium]MBT4721522.1 SDR family NAD(P)-dependent oxidoreductase [Rhodospirillaceae bacterium]
MSVFITGTAGFIGFHTAKVLLARGERVIGLDDLNDYYDVELKNARLAELEADASFTFYHADIANREDVGGIIDAHGEIEGIVHLAAQAGVRYSLENPYTYLHTNIDGQVTLLEACRKLKQLKHIVYASSSSVYGSSTDMPFSVDQKLERPMSVYAASKISCEMMAHCYAHLYGMPLSGLRFFTVYGPWGRPDMAAMIFIRKILAGDAIDVFNNGEMKRDFTYIDDIVAGVVNCLDRPPISDGTEPPSNIYNLGNNRAEQLMDFVHIIEKELGAAASINYLPMQPGDVPETLANIDKSRSELGFEPRVSIEEGLPKLVAWYREYYGS